MSDDRTTDPAPAGLRCPECGEIRTPVVLHPHLPEDTIIVICDECWRRALAMPRAFYPEEKPEPVIHDWWFMGKLWL